MTQELRGRKVAILARTDLLSIHDGEIKSRQFDVYEAGSIPVDRPVTDATVDEYDAQLLPGGTTNPDQLRMNRDAVAFVRAFVETGKPIGVICMKAAV